MLASALAANIALAWLSLWQAVPQEPPAAAAAGRAPASRPATQAARPAAPYRSPEQAQILKTLLQRKESPAGIWPWHPGREQGAAATRPAAAAGTLLLEGTFLMDRPGRLVRVEGQPHFRFHGDQPGAELETMEILPNQFLEIMEHEAQAGVSDFVVSGEVTTYRSRNYLLLRKVLRRVPNRNLSP